jgi:hypothetical protein
LRDQHPAVGIDQGAGGDQNKFHGHGRLTGVIA